MKKIAALILSLTVSGYACADNPVRMGVVVKVGGTPWFNSMEEGIKKEAQKQGIDAWQVGPTSQDPAQQVKAIEDLITQKVDIIGVVPVDPAVLEPVLKKSERRGHQSGGA